MNLATGVCVAPICRSSTYWWTVIIVDLRRECHKPRHLAQRLNNTITVADQLKRDSRGCCSHELLKGLYGDTWGLCNILITRKSKGLRKSFSINAEQMDRIVWKLFHTDHTSKISPFSVWKSWKKQYEGIFAENWCFREGNVIIDVVEVHRAGAPLATFGLRNIFGFVTLRVC